MTVIQKIQEAELFLWHISCEDEDLSKIRYYTSAFLSAIRSITEHALEEANYRLNVGIRDQLYLSDFEKQAKINRNKKALNFLTWFKKELKSLEHDECSSILRNLTNLNLHRKEIQLNISFYISPKNKIDYNEKLHVNFGKTMLDPHYDSMNEVRQVAKDTKMIDNYLQKINSKRKKTGNILETDVEIISMITFPDIPRIRFDIVCVIIYGAMNTWAKSFQKYKKDNWGF